MDFKEVAAIVGCLIGFFGIIWGGMKLSMSIGGVKKELEMKIDNLQKDQDDMQKEFGGFVTGIQSDIKSLLTIKNDFSNTTSRVDKMERGFEKIMEKIDTVLGKQNDLAVQLSNKQNRV